MDIINSLNGHYLIAQPSLEDGEFKSSVVFLCSNGADEGSMGLVINQLVPNLFLGDLLKQIGLDLVEEHIKRPILYGGPVSSDQGHVLHSPEYHLKDSTINITGDICLTSRRKILDDIAHGNGPLKFEIALGHAGWEKGQLEDEIKSGVWLHAPSFVKLLFDCDPQTRYSKSLELNRITRPELHPNLGSG